MLPRSLGACPFQNPDFFEEIGRDVTLQQFYGMRYDTKYLTDRPGEAEFLRSLNKEHEIAKQTATLCARLAHSIPLFADVPIEIVARIRRDDHEAFQQYRAALGDIVQKYVASGRAIGDAEANEIFLDELAPKLMQLERKARLERRAALKKSFLKTAITSAVVGLGIYGGILPSHLVELCKMVGGVKLASDVAETFSSVEKYSTEVRNHNLFFLLRVKQDTHA